MWNVEVAVISIVIGALGTVIKGLIQGFEDLEIRGRVKTIQTIALSRSAESWEVLKTWGNLLSLKLHWLTLVWKILKGENKAWYPRVDVDRIYVLRKGGRGHASNEDNVDASIQQLEDYLEKRKGRLITATRSNTDKTRNNRTEITRKQKR